MGHPISFADRRSSFHHLQPEPSWDFILCCLYLHTSLGTGESGPAASAHPTSDESHLSLPCRNTPLPAPRPPANVRRVFKCTSSVSLITLLFILHVQTDGKTPRCHHVPYSSPIPPGPLEFQLCSAIFIPSIPSNWDVILANLPTVRSLTTALPIVEHGPALKINWARDIRVLVDRAEQNAAGGGPPVGPATIQDPQLLGLVQITVPLVVQIVSARHPAPIPIFVAEATYLRATFSASGAYLDHIQHNPRVAFCDFEQAARAGSRLGRGYEIFNDATHTGGCFKRGVKPNIERYVCLCPFRLYPSNLFPSISNSV